MNKLPETIGQLEQKKQEYAHRAYQLHRYIQPISESADEDLREISEVDHIRMRAIDAIQQFLGSL